MSERWAPVVGYEGRYEVSDMGRVRSVSRTIEKVNRYGSVSLFRWRGRVLRSHTWGAKYPGVVLIDAGGGKQRFMIHRLVAETFIPNPMQCSQVNHIDADTSNAKASNLEWCNQSQNIKHAYRIGNRAIGKRHHFSVLPRDSGGHCASSQADARETEEF